MKNIISVFRYELLRNFKRRGYLFTAFGLPAIVFLGFFLVQTLAQDANEEAQQDFLEEQGFENGVGYVDESGYFQGLGALQGGLIAPFVDVESAQSALDDGLIDAYYVIPEDFEDAQDFMMVIPEFSLNNITGAPIDELIFAVLSNNVDSSLSQRLMNPTNVEEIELQRASEVVDTTGTDGEVVSEEQEQEDFWLVYVFALAFIMSVLGTNGYLMQSVIEEKETRIVEILISSVRPIQLLAGKIFGLGLLGLLQIAAWIGTVFVLSSLVGSTENAGLFGFLDGVEIPVDTVAWLVVYFMLGYLFFAAAFGAIGAISTSLQNGPNLTMFLVFPAMFPFFMIGTFVESPDATLPVLLSLFPLTAPVAMVMRLTVSTVPISELLLSVALLAAFDVLVIWFAGRLFRANSLLAGQLPKLRDVPKLLFGS